MDRLRGIMTVEPVEGLRAADTSALCGACAGILSERGLGIGGSFSFGVRFENKYRETLTVTVERA